MSTISMGAAYLESDSIRAVERARQAINKRSDTISTNTLEADSAVTIVKTDSGLSAIIDTRKVDTSKPFVMIHVEFK